MIITQYSLFLESKRLGRIVLTGGPGTGKTEVIRKLREMKYHVIPEPSRDLLKKLKLSDEKWFMNLKNNPIAKDMLHVIPNDNREAFQQMVEKKNILNYNRNQNGFFDRGLVDEIGFRRYYKKEISRKLISDCNKYRYDSVFFFPPWEEIYINDQERKEPFSQALEMSRHIFDGYKEFGYSPIEVPKKSVVERVGFILGNLK